MHRSLAWCAALSLSCAGHKPVESAKPAASDGSGPVALEGLGPHRRAVSRASAEAQKWFDQGLNVLYAFNHDEAIRAFAKAAQLSPGCAMAFWGIAYANGPHINSLQVDSEHAAAAFLALQQAQAAAHSASPVEQALIEAVAKRYANPQPADRAPLDAAYAEAMEAVRVRFPADADVAALAAEARMNVHAWDYWKPDGSPQPWTAPILAILESGLQLDPRHPMLNHLYIHALEASNDPQRATGAADRLRDLQPGLGHMVHMPSHIFVRTGRWQDAIFANERAIAADDAYRRNAPPQQLYALYMAHNHHMLAYAAMMSGRSATAVAAAQGLVDRIPPDVRSAMAPVVDLYFAMPIEVHMRFGRWDEVLAAPEFGEDLPGSRAIRHAARAIAFAARGDFASAQGEQQKFSEARAKIGKDAIYGNNPTAAVIEVAGHLAAGEVLFLGGQKDAGLAELRKAVEAEDALRYDEPPEWIQPSRHALGAALAQAGRHAEAEQVYREDLRRIPDNGWSLMGLSRALSAQHKKAEAEQAQARFGRIWKDADVQIHSACLCLQGV